MPIGTAHIDVVFGVADGFETNNWSVPVSPLRKKKQNKLAKTLISARHMMLLLLLMLLIYIYF